MEIDNLKVVLQESSKLVSSYTPVRSDPIDCALAEYLINSPPPPQPFVREEPGMYRFGKRKVQMRLENGKLCVKLRSGVKAIEDFINIYGNDDSPSSRTSSIAVFSSAKKKSAVKSPRKRQYVSLK